MQQSTMQQSLFDSVDPAPTDPDSVPPEDIEPEDVQPGDIEPGPTRTADTEAPGATNLDQGSRGNRPGQRKAHEVEHASQEHASQEHASQEYAHHKPEGSWTPNDLAERWGRPGGHLPSRSRAEFILYARFDLHLYWNPDADRLMGAAFENGTLRLSAELDTRRNAALALNELQDFILHYLLGLRPFHEGATGQPVAGRPVTIYQ
jgi:hypothetical protein